MKILWRRVNSPGLEWCEITETTKGAVLTGVVLQKSKRAICRLDYTIRCDSSWRTASATIQGYVGRTKVQMELNADRKGTWFLNERRIRGIDGCIDVDLGFSPSTNLLPIRRLELRSGEPMQVTACWVAFPSLAVRPLRQTYLRQDRTTVHYESAGGKFQRDLRVNSKGVVLSYPGLWEAEGVG